MSRAWISTLPDGRTEYVMHQSWLGDTDLCLERARRGLIGEADPPSDATAVGTGMHAGAEECVNTIIEFGEPLDLDDTLDVAFAAWEREIALPGFEWKKRGKVAAERYLERATTRWWESVMPTLDPLATEVLFGPFVIYEDDRIVIKLGGSIDYVGRDLKVKDWKTGSPHAWKEKDWLKRNGAIQPTVYTWGLELVAAERGWRPPDRPNEFEFVVMLDVSAQHCSVMRVNVVRRPEDWAWLQHKVLSVVSQIESGVDRVWPMNDDGNPLCSAKWCPFWDGCKGAHVHDAWPK